MKAFRNFSKLNLCFTHLHGVWSSFSDYPGPSGEIQGAGTRVNKDRTLSCSLDTRTVPGILQKVYYHTYLGWCFWRLLLPIVLCIISNISLFYITNSYTPNELRYLPVNTALYEPPLDPDLPALDSEPDSDDAEDGNEEKKNKNSSVRYIQYLAIIMSTQI